MYVIAWNLERDRQAAVIRSELNRLLVGWKPGAVVLAEAGGYARTLATLDGYRVVQFDTAPGQRESAMLVRDDVKLGHGQSWAARMTWTGWWRVTGKGGMTAPKWAPTILADGIRLVGVHLPPSVKHADRRGELPRGQVRRVVAYRTYVRRLAGLVAGTLPGRPVVIVGDWNASPYVTGRWSPQWLALKARMDVRAPLGPTSVHRDVPIDYVLARGCHIAQLHTLKAFEHGSDHDPIGFRVVPAPEAHAIWDRNEL